MDKVNATGRVLAAVAALVALASGAGLMFNPHGLLGGLALSPEGVVGLSSLRGLIGGSQLAIGFICGIAAWRGRADAILSGFNFAASRLESEDEIAAAISDATRDAYQLAFDQITPALQAIISDSVDVATSPIEDIQQAFADLGLIASAVAPQLDMIGFQLGDTPTELTVNTNDLIDRLGGTEIALPQLSFIQQEFFPDVGEQVQQQAIDDANSDLTEFSNSIGLFGVNVIDTRDEFAELLLSLDQTTIGGRETAASLALLADEVVLVEDAALAQADALETVTTIFGRFTPAIDGFGTISQQAVDNLIEAAGGLDSLAGSANSFYTNFFTEEERADLALRDATAAVINFNRELGLTGDAAIDTADEFKTYIQSLSQQALAGDEAAAAQLATALAMSDTFALFVDSGQDIRDAIAQLPVEMQGPLLQMVGDMDMASEELAIINGDIATEFTEIGVGALAEMTTLGTGVSGVLETLGTDAETAGSVIQQAGITISSGLTPVEEAYTNVLSPALVNMAEMLRQNGQHALAFDAIGLDEYLGSMVAQGVPLGELFDSLPPEFQNIASELGGSDGLINLLFNTGNGANAAADNVNSFATAASSASTAAFNAANGIVNAANRINDINLEVQAGEASRIRDENGRLVVTLEPQGSFMSGTSFVPETGIYELHQGEVVLPPDVSRWFRDNGIPVGVTAQPAGLDVQIAPDSADGSDDGLLLDLVAEVRQLREDNQRIAAQADAMRARQMGETRQQTSELRELGIEQRRTSNNIASAVDTGTP